jgi:hypothetical protein
MEGTYRLKRILGGISHWAEVTVRIEPAERHEVTVSDDVFGWRRDVYGPEAYSGGPVDQQYVAAAIAGVSHALDRIGGAGKRVIISKIDDAPADTCPPDVKFAAATATCLALNVELDPPLTLEAPQE